MNRQALAAPAPLQLWKVALHELPSAAAIATLSIAEREQAQRFAFEHLRRRYLAAHVALRQVLSESTGLAADSLQYESGPFGKPSLRGASTCAFNMSHSGDVAVIATAPSGEIGVDVEVLRPVSDSLALAQRNFTPAEHQHLLATPSEWRDLVFLRIWTRKEACIKALGYGLSLAPETFEAGVHAHECQVSIATPEGAAELRLVSLPESEGSVMALSWVTAPSGGC
jgi:4'-phosphopantetheinyl transferase